MRCMDGENEMLLTCREQADGVSILRCETRDPVVLLPDEVDGAPVISLGKYAFSGRAPDLAGEKTFSVRVTCGGALPVHQADSIRAVTLPRQLKTVGSYAFYNCRALEELTMTKSVSAFDGGSLMNCRSLRRVTLLASPASATCLPKILGETAAELDVRFEQNGEATPLLFPAYTEELEDLSPAHIFQRRIHGAGYSYRQCFDGAVLNLRQYDRALSELAERHDFRSRPESRCAGLPRRSRSRTAHARTTSPFSGRTAARSPARLRREATAPRCTSCCRSGYSPPLTRTPPATPPARPVRPPRSPCCLRRTPPRRHAAGRKTTTFKEGKPPCSPQDGPKSAAKSCFPRGASFI